MEINKLIWDKKIYPRGNKTKGTIDAYIEAMRIGAVFPPIEVQHVSGYRNGSDEPKEAWLIIDGVHRWQAYQELKQGEIEIVECFPDQTLDYNKSWIDLLLISARRNTAHGDRVNNNDKKNVARSIAEADPDVSYTEEMIAAELGVTRQTINNWISDIRARQRAGRNNTIIKLSRLGWAQEEIGEKVGLSQNRVAEIIGNANFGEIDNFLAQARQWQNGNVMDNVSRDTLPEAKELV